MVDKPEFSKKKEFDPKPDTEVCTTASENVSQDGKVLVYDVVYD